MHRQIAEQLLLDYRQNESTNCELNERFTELALEQQIETNDPDGGNFAAGVCALCRSGIVRMIG